MPLRLAVSCVQEKDQLVGVAIITDTFDFLLYAQHNNMTRLWVRAGVSELKEYGSHTL